MPAHDSIALDYLISLLSKIGFFFGQHLKPIDKKIQPLSLGNLHKQAYFMAIGQGMGLGYLFLRPLQFLDSILRKQQPEFPMTGCIVLNQALICPKSRISIYFGQ